MFLLHVRACVIIKGSVLSRLRFSFNILVNILVSFLQNFSFPFRQFRGEPWPFWTVSEPHGVIRRADVSTSLSPSAFEKQITSFSSSSGIHTLLSVFSMFCERRFASSIPRSRGRFCEVVLHFFRKYDTSMFR